MSSKTIRAQVAPAVSPSLTEVQATISDTLGEVFAVAGLLRVAGEAIGNLEHGRAAKTTSAAELGHVVDIAVQRLDEIASHLDDLEMTACDLGKIGQAGADEPRPEARREAPATSAGIDESAALLPNCPAQVPALPHRFLSKALENPGDFHFAAAACLERAESVLDTLIELHLEDRRLGPALDVVKLEILDVGEILMAWIRREPAADGAEDSGHGG